eukprot:1576460-Rhodomonas_salina.1
MVRRGRRRKFKKKNPKHAHKLLNSSSTPRVQHHNLQLRVRVGARVASLKVGFASIIIIIIITTTTISIIIVSGCPSQHCGVAPGRSGTGSVGVFASTPRLAWSSSRSVPRYLST